MFRWLPALLLAAPALAGPGCPENYVRIPGNPEFRTRTFCLMQFHAKNVGGRAVSAPAGTPWVKISRDGAVRACRALGPGYDLISNAQWQTVATDIAKTAENWSGDAANGWKPEIGVGRISRGWSDGDDEHPARSVSDLSNPCDQTSDKMGDHSCNIRSSPAWSRRRTFVLSSGQVVWDFAGNVWSWVKDRIHGSSFKPSLADDDWNEFNGPRFPLKPSSRNRRWFAPPSPSWNSAQGLGQLRSGPGGAIHRGGNWDAGVYSGIFSASLFAPPRREDDLTGFRCVKN